jgi:hypothetical protein
MAGSVEDGTVGFVDDSFVACFTPGGTPPLGMRTAFYQQGMP